MMNTIQKDDIRKVFGPLNGVGNLDYVTAWYKKAVDIMDGTTIRTAFVSTNSVTQGEQPAILWKPLTGRGVHIDFGWRTFKWSNEAKGRAAVHCVIIGFSTTSSRTSKKIFDSDGTKTVANNINPYLVDAPVIFIDNRTKPLCNAPTIGMGNQPIDDGNYLFTKDEMNEFLKIEPQAKKLFMPWVGSFEFINGRKRYCLWLGNCSPSELKKMPEVMKRVKAVQKFRQNSKRASTNKIADFPTRFQTENMPSTDYIVIPEISSERRRYIPFGFQTSNILCSNKLRLMPNGTLYHFGVLTSNVHMAWTRAVTGRLKSDFQYSINIVYNNFPWPEATANQEVEIKKLAQNILDTRAKFPKNSLADLYDPLTMPPELLKAHQALDRAVMKLYGFKSDWPESKIVAALMERYQELCKKKTS